MKRGSHSFFLTDLDISGKVASEYGFVAVNVPKMSIEDKKLAEGLGEDIHTGETEERLNVLRFLGQEDLHVPQPPMLYLKRPAAGSSLRKRTNFESCGLEIYNVNRAPAEALLIQTAYAILADSGVKNIRIEINSLGDKDSYARFERELSAYLRKNNQHTPTDERLILREDMPKPLNFLSESSRLYFKEVLEFIEAAGLPYQINDTLLGNKAVACQTIFEIKGTVGGSETTLAYGGRYNYLAKKAGCKKDLPACGVTIFYPKSAAVKKKNSVKPARFYVIQLGSLAKFQTLNLIERLRQEKIGVYHSLTKENLSGQMASAEYLKVSHLLIIGQKEAIERTVVVRSTDIREQETVGVEDLPRYLKKILDRKR